ncbi:MAG: hypothetical protein ACREIA_03305 [Opitutaceae bacterium]
MRRPTPSTVRAVLFVLAVAALVCAPFVIWGETFAVPLLREGEHRTGWMVAIAVVLLAADSVAPVPSTLVVMFLAAHSGRVAGCLGGTLGLSAGVLTAAWIGRSAVGRIAPRFFPEAELARLRVGLRNRLAVTLGCLRSVPVLAETSVIVAAAAGIPIRRIVRVTLLPNAAISIIYSLAADDSFAAAVAAFLATMVVSYAIWRWLERRSEVRQAT